MVRRHRGLFGGTTVLRPRLKRRVQRRYMSRVLAVQTCSGTTMIHSAEASHSFIWVFIIAGAFQWILRPEGRVLKTAATEFKL